jgi:hypothetical protein
MAQLQGTAVRTRPDDPGARKSATQQVVDHGARLCQTGPAGPIVVTAEEQVNRYVPARPRREDRDHHGLVRATAGQFGVGEH